MSAIWRREDAAERGKIRAGWLDRHHTSLIVALVAAEEERAIRHERSADIAAALLPPEERIGIRRIATQRRIGCQVVVAIQREAAATKLITASPRHNVHRTIGRETDHRIEIHRRHLEFLDDVLR